MSSKKKMFTNSPTPTPKGEDFDEFLLIQSIENFPVKSL